MPDLEFESLGIYMMIGSGKTGLVSGKIHALGSMCSPLRPAQDISHETDAPVPDPLTSYQTTKTTQPNLNANNCVALDLKPDFRPLPPIDG